MYYYTVNTTGIFILQVIKLYHMDEHFAQQLFISFIHVNICTDIAILYYLYYRICTFHISMYFYIHFQYIPVQFFCCVVGVCALCSVWCVLCRWCIGQFHLVSFGVPVIYHFECFLLFFLHSLLLVSIWQGPNILSRK